MKDFSGQGVREIRSSVNDRPPARVKQDRQEAVHDPVCLTDQTPLDQSGIRRTAILTNSCRSINGTAAVPASDNRRVAIQRDGGCGEILKDEGILIRFFSKLTVLKVNGADGGVNVHPQLVSDHLIGEIVIV